ncbi:MAG: HPr family phosphocarrier protein [Candidatus Omnitrophota bacterium]
MSKVEEEIIVKNSHGLHVRPVSIFVQIANKYDSAIRLEKDGEIADGKSIMAILSLGINRGAQVKLVVEGTDAQDAHRELKDFLVSEHD